MSGPLSPSKDDLFPPSTSGEGKDVVMKRRRSRKSSSLGHELFKYDSGNGKHSDWINPLLRHAIFVDKMSRLDEDGEQRVMHNWANPNVLSGKVPEADPGAKSGRSGPRAAPAGSKAVVSVCEGDTFIRTYMKAGEAFFRVATVSNAKQEAFNREGLGVPFEELLNPKRYELLYRGDGITSGTPDAAGGSTPPSRSPPASPTERGFKVDALTESKYFGKKNCMSTSMNSNARFYGMFHAYGVETGISGVVEPPEMVLKGERVSRLFFFFFLSFFIIILLLLLLFSVFNRSWLFLRSHCLSLSSPPLMQAPN